MSIISYQAGKIFRTSSRPHLALQQWFPVLGGFSVFKKIEMLRYFFHLLFRIQKFAPNLDPDLDPSLFTQLLYIINCEKKVWLFYFRMYSNGTWSKFRIMTVNFFQLVQPFFPDFNCVISRYLRLGLDPDPQICWIRIKFWSGSRYKTQLF